MLLLRLICHFRQSPFSFSKKREAKPVRYLFSRINIFFNQIKAAFFVVGMEFEDLGRTII
jgi:hypothetical protein